MDDMTKTKKQSAARSKPKPGTAPAAAVNSKGNPIQPSRAGRVLIGGHFLPAVQRELKILAIREGKTLHQVIAEAYSDLLIKRGLPSVAELEK
jgi:hypothetical protein